MKFLERIFSIKNNDIHKVITILGLKIKLKNMALVNKNNYIDIKKTIAKQNNKINSLEKQLNNMNKYNLNRLKRITPQARLATVSVHLVEHCNMNCYGCDNFSPLAEESYENIQNFEKDIKRLAELTNGELCTLSLLGGEPLLHPDINEFLKISRAYLPSCRIEIITNGILLPTMNTEFYKACNEFDIVICPTKYPINIDYNKAEALAKKYGVKYEYFTQTDEHIKTLFHIPLDLEGKQNCIENFLNCYHANHCVFLKQGRLYTCTVAPNIEHFNKFFNKNLILNNRDGIDIHKAKSLDEVLSFLAKPIPFCKYCNVKERTYETPWCTSKKEIEEWT